MKLTRDWITSSLLLVLALAFAAGGCKSMKKKFSSRRIADFGTFSSQSAALLGDYNPAFSDLELLRLRPLLEPSAPEETRLRELNLEAQRGRLFLIEFSMRISSIPEVEGELEQVAIFADLLDQLAGFMREHGPLPAEAEEALTEVRAQQSLWAAAGLSVPVLKALLEVSADFLDEIDEGLEDLVGKLKWKIDERHATIIHRAETLDESRDSLLVAMETTWKARGGDEEARAALESHEAVALVGGIGEKDLQLEDLMKRLLERFEWIERIDRVIKDDLIEYRGEHAELDQAHAQARKRLNVARVQMLTWLLAYGRMVSGTVESAEWFDLNDTPALLVKAL